AKEILFVCNEKKLLELTKKHLENYNENYSIQISDSVEKAIKLIQKQAFDAIISDYDLKKKNGLEFLAHLKDIDYETSFILLINQGKEEIAIKALNLGAEYYILKSNNLKLFFTILTNYIDNIIKKRSIKTDLDKTVHSLSKTEERIENLRESEQWFHNLVDRMSDALGIINADGELTYVNKKFCELLGYAEHEMLKRSLTDFLTPTGKKMYKKQIEKRRKGITDQFDQEWLKSDGEIVYTIVSPQPLFTKDGTYEGSFAVITDITKRKQDEEELRIVYDQLTTIFETVGDGLLVIDHQCNILRHNKDILRMFGYKEDEVLGKKCYDVFPHKNCQTSACTLSQVFKNKRKIVYESTKHHKNGKEITFLISATPLFSDEGKLIGMVENLKDITERKAAEEVMRKSEEKYRQLFHNINDPVFLGRISPEGIISSYIEVNDLACKVTGYSRAKLLKLKPQDIFQFKSPEELKQVLSILNEKGQIIVESDLKKKNGTSIHVEINAQIINYEGENAVLSIVRDITKLKRVNEELMEITIDIQERLKELNCLYEVTHYALSKDYSLEDYFEHILRIIPPAWFYPEYTCARIIYNEKTYQSKNFIETKWKLSSNLIISKKTVGKLEIFYTEEKPQRDIGPFLKEEQDLLIALTWHINEYISKRDAEEEIRKSKEFYQAVADNAYAGIIIVDLNENITYVNDSFAKLLDYNANELIGLNMSEITLESEYLKFELYTKTRRIDDKSDSYETILLKKDKTIVNVYLSATPLKDKNGNVIESLGVVVDISILKKTEKNYVERQRELERQRDELNSFASTIAHDIRGRMQFISFYNSMIETDYSENIDDSIDDILQFVEDILVLSREGEILSKKINVDIVKLVEKITTKIHRLDPKINFNIGDIPKIYGDPLRLYQVFENLLINIHKHAKATQVEIASKTFKNKICISIKDNGKGMGVKRKQSIIDSWTTRKYTSFGMLIVNKIVKAHNGEISLESELGKGTTVNLYFPIK
ncbi:MAG: PAS domain S-box protein, partial [Candidatus Heimdallarchaeota archaeon]|nr:PAS domain S-box protein [Candidatus Heimdallarchaeota archaeon]